ncbi:Na+/H+ antiporter subunit E [Allopusillimonas ginsengisoli]|uniref:Na+/H+ antiporter subunit E n=1 Tax=Allopusillimonas ginsengisoli TaxID=453575 RepID=UPI0010C1AD43|nr:Na+/H+ antiporter subunit E [Allopusillimonas ginsengisoli]
MSRIVNALVLPSLLLALWILLNDSVSPGNIAIGAVLALGLSWALHASRLRPLHARPRHPLVILKLALHVAIDIARSNVAVARIIILGRHANASPGFISIPLRIKDPHALAALACIVTYTPGTVWADYSEEHNLLTLHVLDLQEEALWLNIIQQRYERPLLEIFE